MNLQSIDKKKSKARVKDTTNTVAQAIEIKSRTTEEWNEIVQKGEELREAEILDVNAICIDGDDEKSKKYRKKVSKKLRRAEKRKLSLSYLTNNIKRGEKQLLIHVHIKNNNGTKSTLYERQEVEVTLVNQSLKHFKKAIETDAYKK